MRPTSQGYGGEKRAGCESQRVQAARPNKAPHCGWSTTGVCFSQPRCRKSGVRTMSSGWGPLPGLGRLDECPTAEGARGLWGTLCSGHQPVRDTERPPTHKHITARRPHP